MSPARHHGSLIEQRGIAGSTLVMLIACHHRGGKTKVRGESLQGVAREARIRIEDKALLTGQIDDTPARRGIVGTRFEAMLQRSPWYHTVPKGVMAPMLDRLPVGLALIHGYGIDHQLALDDKEDTDLW